MSLLSKTTTIPNKCLYTERVECFTKLAEIQLKMKAADEEYITVSMIEGKEHKNAYNRLEYHTSEYRKEYKRCKEIIR